MKTFAGIGSRNISKKEENDITYIGRKLWSYEYILFSGNATGSDITFEMASNGRCVLMLPYNNFNNKFYNISNSLDSFVLGDSPEGIKVAKELHPLHDKLDEFSLKYHARNYHQVFGYDIYPKVDFVICCADRYSSGNIKGGTGMAARIAKKNNIKLINIRDPDWKNSFDELIEQIEMFNSF